MMGHYENRGCAKTHVKLSFFNVSKNADIGQHVGAF